MPHISLRVTEEERAAMESYAEVKGLNLSQAIKTIFFNGLKTSLTCKESKSIGKEKQEAKSRCIPLTKLKRNWG